MYFTPENELIRFVCFTLLCLPTDEHCHHLVEDGITDKLLNIIKGNNSEPAEPNITLQHAVLSALRNLAIPGEEKTNEMFYLMTTEHIFYGYMDILL